MLYQKSLRINQATKGALGVGKIVNLQSNDAAKLWGLAQYLHILWSGPFQVRGFKQVSTSWWFGGARHYLKSLCSGLIQKRGAEHVRYHLSVPRYARAPLGMQS